MRAGFGLLVALIGAFALSVGNVAGQNSAPICEPITPANVLSLKPIQTLKLEDALQASWSADSKTLAVATSAEIDLFHTPDFSSTAFSPMDSEVIVNAAFNRDASLVAFGSQDVQLLDLVSGRQRILPNLTAALGSHHLEALAFNSDATQLAATDDDGDIYVWNIASDRQINQANVGQKFAGSGLFYNSDNSKLISFSVHAVAVLDPDTLQALEVHDPSNDFVPPIVTQVAFTPDENVLVVLYTYSADSSTSLIFLSKGFVDDLVISGITHYTDGSSFALSPDSNLLATSTKNELYVVQLDKQTDLMLYQPALVVLEGQPSPPKLISFSPDMRYLVSISQYAGTAPSIHDDGTMIIWGVCGES